MKYTSGLAPRPAGRNRPPDFRPLAASTHLPADRWREFSRAILEATPARRRPLVRFLTYSCRGKAACWPGNARIAEELGVSTATVKRHLAELKALGIVDCVPMATRNRRVIVLLGHPGARELLDRLDLSRQMAQFEPTPQLDLSRPVEASNSKLESEHQPAIRDDDDRAYHDKGGEVPLGAADPNRRLGCAGQSGPRRGPESPTGGWGAPTGLDRTRTLDAVRRCARHGAKLARAIEGCPDIEARIRGDWAALLAAAVSIELDGGRSIERHLAYLLSRFRAIRAGEPLNEAVRARLVEITNPPAPAPDAAQDMAGAAAAAFKATIGGWIEAGLGKGATPAEIRARVIDQVDRNGRESGVSAERAERRRRMAEEVLDERLGAEPAPARPPRFIPRRSSIAAVGRRTRSMAAPPG